MAGLWASVGGLWASVGGLWASLGGQWASRDGPKWWWGGLRGRLGKHVDRPGDRALAIIDHQFTIGGAWGKHVGTGGYTTYEEDAHDIKNTLTREAMLLMWGISRRS